jgi:hypothetical protein
MEINQRNKMRSYANRMRNEDNTECIAENTKK